MKRVAGVVACGIAIFFGSISIAASPASQEVGVVGMALAKLEIPERISAVFWTRRKVDFTLQISRRTDEEPRLLPASGFASAKKAPPLWEPMQVGLLRSDGTHIPASRSSEAPDPARKYCSGAGHLPRQCWDYEFLYSFPLSVGAEEVAVALRVGDVFLIEKLPTFAQ